jgi:hypothetical protein
MFRAFPPMKVFIRFDLAGQLVTGGESQSKPDAVIEEPCRLLSDPDGAMDFATADTVFGVHNLPHGHQPLV